MRLSLSGWSLHRQVVGHNRVFALCTPWGVLELHFIPPVAPCWDETVILGDAWEPWIEDECGGP